MLTVTDLTVRYPDGYQALSGVGFSIAPGESVALIGANGAGKTTLILSLLGLLPGEGIVALEGTILSKATQTRLRQEIGLVFQNPDDQLFMPTILEDVAFGIENQGVPLDEARRRAEQTLEALGIAHLGAKTPVKLSGGEKRMAALATVLAMEPKLLVLDEPTAFLDPKARRLVLNTLNGLPQAKLVATHDLPFAAAVCRRAILLKNGRVFAEGPCEKLLYDEKLMDDCGVEAIGV